jgi:cation diffusion facilitator CzcD-associated flavoprotein CzcO
LLLFFVFELQVQDLENGLTFSDFCDVFVSSGGNLNNWKWPDLPGLHNFKGKLLHTAKWDESYDYKVKMMAQSVT